MRYQESDKVELKRKITKDLDKEIIAFLNAEGGTIYIGVEDDGTIIGIDNNLRDDLDLQISSIVCDAIKRDARSLIRHYFNEDNVMVIEVMKGDNKPYFLSSTGPRSNGTYIRVGRSKRQATDGEIISMIRDYSKTNWEDEISPDQELHFSYANLYFHNQNLEFNEEKYFTIGIRNSNSKFTNLALLLSDENPIIVKMACYDNVLNFNYKKEFTGSIIKIANDVLNEAEMFNITSATIPEFGGIRIETKSYPGKSLRETILNALCHADYSMPSNIKIEFYSDKVEITNPGGIYRYGIDDILLGIQSFRNPKLIAVFHRLGFIENYGTGLKRIREAYPNYDIGSFLMNSRQWFRLTLPDLNYEKQSLMGNVPQNVPQKASDVPQNVPQKASDVPQNVPQTDLDRIILAIGQNNQITRSELAKTIGKSTKTVARIIKESRCINFIGSSKTGHWEIIDKKQNK